MVTTSHDPSVKLKIFAKEMKLIFPNSKRINRGNTELASLIGECRKNNFTDLIVLHETRGKPDGMIGTKIFLISILYFFDLIKIFSVSFTVWSDGLFQFIARCDAPRYSWLWKNERSLSSPYFSQLQLEIGKSSDEHFEISIPGSERGLKKSDDFC